MPFRVLLIGVVSSLCHVGALADDVLHRYEGNVFPYDESAGWQVYDPCSEPCTELLQDGHFVLYWPEPGDRTNYVYWIAQAPDAPPLAVGRVALPLQPSHRAQLLHLRRQVYRSLWRDA